MAISRNSSNDSTGITSATYSTTPTAGNLLLCLVTSNSTSGSLSGWNTIGHETTVTTAKNIWLYAKTSDGTEGTATPSGGTITATSLCEYTGVMSPYTTDGGPAVTRNAGASLNLTTNAVTTTLAADLIFHALAHGTAISSPSAATGTVILNNNVTIGHFGVEYIPGTTVSSYTDLLSWTGSSQAAVITISFQAGILPNVNDTEGTSENVPTPGLTFSVDREPAVYQDGKGVVIV